MRRAPRVRQLEPRLPDPLFVGGTGRSGTTVVGSLVGAHPQFFAPPFELRLHTQNVLPLLEGRMAFEEFEEEIWSKWFHTAHRPTEGGISLLHGEKRVGAAIAAFKGAYRERPVESARRLVRTIMDPLAASAAARVWVDTTPNNAQHAQFLARLFSRARFIHMVRNGLDVACSVVPQPWGPNDPESGLAWWEERLRAADAELASLDPDRVLTLHLEDLVGGRRDECYGRLLSFLSAPDSPEMRRYFDEQVQPTNALRWRVELSTDLRKRLVRTYERMLERLVADGVGSTPGRFAHLER